MEDNYTINSKQKWVSFSRKFVLFALFQFFHPS